MKVVFLDIDGVLNSMKYLDANQVSMNRTAGENDSFKFWSEMFDPEAMKLLNEVIQKSGAKVVISSSWRNGHRLEDIIEYMKRKGFVGDIIGKTPQRAPNPPYRRGNEIQAWLAEHPEVEKFVIIDDDSDMEHLSPYLVQTSWATGLLPEHVEPMLKLLQ